MAYILNNKRTQRRCTCVLNGQCRHQSNTEQQHRVLCLSLSVFFSASASHGCVIMTSQMASAAADRCAVLSIKLDRSTRDLIRATCAVGCVNGRQTVASCVVCGCGSCTLAEVEPGCDNCCCYCCCFCYQCHMHRRNLL